MTLIDKAEALLPCPFCGGEATFSEGKTGDGKPWHYVECSDCEAMGPGVSYADHNIAVKSALADAWNRRAIPARGAGEAGPAESAVYDRTGLPPVTISPAPDAREAAQAQAREAWRIAGMVTNNAEAKLVHEAICALLSIGTEPPEGVRT